MQKKRTFARFLLVLQLLQFFAVPVALHANSVADAPELMDLDVPTSAIFKAIKLERVSADLSGTKKKAKDLTLSAKKLEKLANRSTKKKKNNNALRSAILDFFAASSPEWDTATKFTKPRDWKDLQLYSGKTTLVESIYRGTLECSQEYTCGLLAQRAPIKATSEREDLIASLIEKDDLKQQLKNFIAAFAPHEETFFSNTLQEEDEAIRIAIDGLKPGWFLRQLPKKLFSENPDFMRFHAALTQKTAPYFWNPLIKMYDEGSSISAAGVAALLIFWRWNGIPQTIFRDWLAYTAYEAQKDPYMNPNAGSPAERTLTKTALKLVLFCAWKTPSYFFKHLFPMKNGLPTTTALKAGAGLLSDAFLWPTTELRLSLAQPSQTRPATPAIATEEDDHELDRPKPLGSGPHCSLWMNGQYNKSVLFKILHSGAVRYHQAFFGQRIPDETTPAPVGLLRTVWAMMINQVRILKTATDLPGRPAENDIIRNAARMVDAAHTAVAATTDVIQLGMDAVPNAGPLLSLATQAAGAVAQAASARVRTQPSWWGRAYDWTATKFDSIMAAGALAEQEQQQAAVQTVSGEAAIAPTGRRVPTPEKPLKQRCAQQLSEDVIHMLGHYASTNTQPTRKPWQTLAANIIYCILIKYLWNLWQTRNNEQKIKVDILDRIMFTSTRPAMTLLSATSNAIALLEANKTHLPLPGSLKTKVATFKALVQDGNKEFFMLAQSKTFKKDTGHKLLDHTGEVRRAYELLQDTSAKQLLQEAVHFIAELDSYLGIATLAQEYSEGENQLCPVQFINADTPFINAKNAWFSLLGKNAIGSDLLMGNGNATNILLTGMNGGGKSIMLKTCIFTIILAHTFGYTTAQQCSMTPLAELNLHLSSLDNAAEGKSRWVAEAEAIVSMINSAETMHSPNYFILILGDELGDGTAPDASIRVMIKLLSTISVKPHVLSFISSHLQPLTELEKTMPRITNYRINPHRKLEPGINTTNIALAVFEKFSNTKRKADGFAAALANQTTQPHITMVT